MKKRDRDPKEELVFLGAGVYFAAFSFTGSDTVWKVPLSRLREFGFESRLFSYSRFATDGRFTFRRRNLGKLDSALLQSRVARAVSAVTKVPQYDLFFARSVVSSVTNLKLNIGRRGVILYRGFVVLQEKLQPLETRNIKLDKQYAERIFDINKFFWGNGVGFFRYAELLGFENHALTASGVLKGIDLTGVTTDREKLLARVGSSNQKFCKYLSALSDSLKRENSSTAIAQFNEFCLQNYSTEAIARYWRDG